MTLLTVSGALVLLGFTIAAVTVMTVFVVEIWRTLGPERPRRPVYAPAMPVPYWAGREGPPSFLVSLRAVDSQTVEIPAWAAETEPLWQYATGEWPALIDAMDRQ